MSDDDRLADLAARIADGAPIDWDAAQTSAGSRQDADAIRELEVLASIAQLHRQAITDSLASAAPPEPPVERPPAESGSRVWGPLRILEPLGSGSFGDVFRAWDTSLDREVALKLMRHRHDSASDSIAREGQMLARISHANVMAIYGAQAIDGQVGIWGEYLRGRTLAQIVGQSGPLSAEETLVVADAVARALAAAHRAGLLHRDIKAQNVIREKGGRIVLMDFGLGRDAATESEPTGRELAGTPLYLAPELFAGGRASVQSDLYSLGVLMFYLVTGTFPVVGRRLEDIASQHAAGRRQRLQDLRPDLPAPFVQLVERALEPDPAARFESAGAMQAAIAAHRDPFARQAAPARIGTLLAHPIFIAVALAAVLAAAAIGWFVNERGKTPPPPITFSLRPPPGTHFGDSTRNVPAISPDGSLIAFVATDNQTGDSRLWLHSLRTMTVQMVAESRRAATPFWSPDGNSIAFFAEGGLKRITIGGVRSDTITSAVEPRGGTWNQQGVILFSRSAREGLVRVDANAHDVNPMTVATPDATRGEIAYMWPQFLPDGRRFLYFVLSNDDAVRGVYLGSLDGTRGKRILASDTGAALAGNALVFVRDGNLAAQPFDAAGGTLAEGEATVVAQNVAATFDFHSGVTGSTGGTLVYSPAERTRMTWYERNGRPVGPLDLPGPRFRSPVLSVDSAYLAVQRYRDALSELPIFDLRRGGILTTLTHGISVEPAHTFDVQFPVWAPGPPLRIVYASSDSGWLDLYEKRLDSNDSPRLVAHSESDKMPTDWSPDGKFVTYTDLPKDGSHYHLWVVNVADGSKPVMFGNGQVDDGWARFSRDGKHVAYVSTESGRAEVWVQTFPGGTDRHRVSSDGGVDPQWLSADELTFLDTSGRLMLAGLDFGQDDPVRRSEVLFATHVRTPGASRNNYAWRDDGRQVLINESAADPAESQLVVIVNWIPPHHQ